MDSYSIRQNRGKQRRRCLQADRNDYTLHSGADKRENSRRDEALPLGRIAATFESV